MKSSVNAMYLGIKVTEFESNRYLKVFLGVLPEPEDKNISGMDVLICGADIQNLHEYEKLQSLKHYEFQTKVQSGAQNKVAIKVVGIKKPAATAKQGS